MLDTHVSLAHGNGGRYMRELIESLFARHLVNPSLDVTADAVLIHLPPGEIVVTTDGFTVQPLEFPGGDIGALAVHGTVNDLAVSGARPHFLTLSVFIEEGFEIATLDRIIQSMAHAAREAGVSVAAGDTKVLRRGEGGGLYLATTGIGVRVPGYQLGLHLVRADDCILVSGPIGDHGVSVMLAREQFGLHGNLCSDASTVLPLTEALLGLDGLRFMRDPTRGGLATVTNEIVRASGLGIYLDEMQIPVRESVRAVCDILGYDPLYLACEGRVVAVVAPTAAESALSAWRSLPEGSDAALIGTLAEVGGSARTILRTPLGGERILNELEDDPLPRIC